MLYALGVGLGLDPDGRAAARLRLREEPQGAADHGGGDRLSGLLGEGARHRHRLGQGGGGRACAHAAPAAHAARHGGQPHARHRDRRQGRRARARSSIPSAPSTTRRPASASRPSCRPRSAAATAASAARRAKQPPVHPIPERAPDLVCDLPTRPETALIYRLCADPNPLHADPAVAKAAGFPRPILHGLATFGVAGHAILKSAVRLRSGAAHRDRRAASRRRCFRARPSAPRCGATAGGELPRPRGRARRDRAQQRPRRNRCMIRVEYRCRPRASGDP